MPYLILPAEAQASQLPETGQTTSYTSGDDGHYQAGFDPATRFEVVDIGNNQVVIDHATSLMWPKIIDTFHAYYQTNWYDSISGCEASTFAGFSDWRLPNIRELSSIIDYGLGRVFSIFDGIYVNYYYWTSTSYRNDTSKALVQSMQGISQVYTDKTSAGTRFFVGARNI